MSPFITFFPEQASKLAKEVDLLYFYLIAVSLLFTVLIFAALFIFATKYRQRSTSEIPKPVHGNLMLELIWSVIPLIIAMTMFFWGAKIFFQNSRPPANALEIFVVAKQWMWKIQHPEGAREINELHIPVNQPVKLKMTSEDVIHSFYVPAFRTKMDVVPGRYTTTWFQATKTGRFHLFCAEYCGTQHAGMTGWIVVMEPSDYEKWLESGASTLTPAASEPLSVQGAAIFKKMRCDTCHFAGSAIQGPDLGDIFGTPVNLEDGRTVTADENYLRESILKPKAKVVAGYQAVMPTYKNLISEEDILALIAYIKTLKKAPSAAEIPASPVPSAGETTEDSVQPPVEGVDHGS